jgi:hypothetical protein
MSAIADRLFARCMPIPECGCWIWMGALSGGGYGCAGYPQEKRIGSVHRMMWEDRNGPVPDGLELDHKCRVRSCVNPDHLEPVTRQVNVLRAKPYFDFGAHQRAKTACPKGHPYDYFYRGGRYCRTCRIERNRIRDAARRAQKKES